MKPGKRRTFMILRTPFPSGKSISIYAAVFSHYSLSTFSFLISLIVVDVRDGASCRRPDFFNPFANSFVSFTSLVPTMRSSADRCSVRLWQCGIICGTCERRDAAPRRRASRGDSSDNLSFAQARIVFRPVQGKIRISFLTFFRYDAVLSGITLWLR